MTRPLIAQASGRSPAPPRGIGRPTRVIEQETMDSTSPTAARTPWIGVLGVTCLAVAVGGCGSGDPFSYKKVSGKVTYEDGSAIPSDSVIVTFAPQAEPIGDEFHPRSGMAYVDGDGAFDAVTSYKYGDGIVRGEHKVLVSIRGGPTRPGKKTEPLIPPRYSRLATTPLLVHTDDSPFHIVIDRSAD